LFTASGRGFFTEEKRPLATSWIEGFKGYIVKKGGAMKKEIKT
jgi:hypothetical protein